MLKRAVKQGIFFSLYAFGALRPGRMVPVIVYHSVDESGSCISMPRAEFSWQMTYLRDQGYRTLTAREFVDLRRRGERTPQGSVVLTFDDGIENNYTVAYPLMKKLGLTATIFLTTGFLGKTVSWDKEEDIPDLPLMTWDMAREMVSSGFDFQSHTVSHPHLPELSPEEIRQELKDSRLAIEDHLATSCNILCYPYAEFDEHVIRIALEEGYIAAFAGQPEHESLHMLQRVGSAQFGSRMAFRAAIRGTFPFYYSLKKVLRPRRML